MRNASAAAVNEALAAAFLPPSVLPISFTALLVNTGAKLVLIDTGTAGQITDSAGFMNANLAAAGIAPDAIDTIVISHFHPDHIDGIKTKDGDKVFRNAEILVPEPEWKFWMDDGNMSRASGAVHRYFLNARRIFKDIAKEVRPFKPGAEVAPGIVSVPAFGHTPGHTAFAIYSGEQSMLAMSDTAREPWLFVRHPEWQPSYDMDGPLAAKTRTAHARPRGGRPHAGRGLSLPVPGLRPHRQERQRLRVRAGDVGTALTRDPRANSPLHLRQLGDIDRLRISELGCSVGRALHGDQIFVGDDHIDRAFIGLDRALVADADQLAHGAGDDRIEKELRELHDHRRVAGDAHLHVAPVGPAIAAELVPRMNTEVCAPDEPFCTTCRPGTAVSASVTVRRCSRSISSPVMTVSELAISLTGVGTVVGLTTICGKTCVLSCAFAACANNASARAAPAMRG